MSKLREAALNAEDLKRENIVVSEWGGNTYQLRGLGFSEYREVWKASLDDSGVQADPAKFYPALIIAGAHDPDGGDKVFSSADRDSLANRNGSVLERLASIVLRLSGADAGEVEKNSESTLSASSSSGSPSASEG